MGRCVCVTWVTSCYLSSPGCSSSGTNKGKGRKSHSNRTQQSPRSVRFISGHTTICKNSSCAWLIMQRRTSREERAWRPGDQVSLALWETETAPTGFCQKHCNYELINEENISPCAASSESTKANSASFRMVLMTCTSTNSCTWKRELMKSNTVILN